MTKDRGLGIAVVLAAALALIAVSRLSGPDLPGEAVAVALQPIPAVGSCLDTRGSTPTPVACNRRHTAEVYQSWRKGRSPADISDRCAADGGIPPVPSGGDWSRPPSPTFSARLSSPGPVGWEVCAFIAAVDGDPSDPLTFVGSLTPGSTGRSAAVIGACYAGRNVRIDCAAPHRVERIGLFLASSVDPRPREDCQDFARRVVGASAFSGPDALLAVTGLDRSGPVTIVDATTGEPVLPDTCSVVASRPLVDSVQGLGDKPLPFG
ncbi:hypothetical protein [Nakamurella lactea]|uniref:hypothetical protein n=1 Tax=Nakamurella lactea TaxID=459515 RepID=UPI0012B65D07|nr:hypothetical protein [Nakamurella lactea]